MIDYTITWEKVKSNHPELTEELASLQLTKETAYSHLMILSYVGGALCMYLGCLIWSKLW